MYCLIDGGVLSKQICIEHEEKYAFGNSIRIIWYSFKLPKRYIHIIIFNKLYSAGALYFF
jgi:hypothetical protein